jgi:hypothetical protein
MLRIFEWKIIRKIYRSIIGEECWRIRKNEIKGGQIL